MKKNTLLIYSLCLLAVMVLSCNNDDKVETYDINSTSLLVVENQKGLRNQQIPLLLKGNNDEDYTSLATFYINGNPIDGNLFSSSSEGVFEVYAAYNLAGAMTNTETQTVEIFKPKRKVLIEDFTGNWCGSCPTMVTFVKEAMDLTDHIAVVSIHGNSLISSVDPLTIDEGTFLKDYFEVPWYPWGIINRTEVWNTSDISIQIIASAGINTDVSIGIKSEIIGDNLTVEVSIISEENMSNNKLVIFLLEDGILLDQVNYHNSNVNSPWYQMGNPIPNFQHDHVLRMSLTDPLGDSLLEVEALTIQNQNFSVTLPSQFNKANLSLVAMVVTNSNIAINAQFAHVNELKEFQ